MSMTASDLAQLSAMYDSAGALQKSQIEKQYKLGKDQIANAYRIAQMESGDRAAALANQRQINQDNLAQARLEMERIGIPRLEIERYVAEKNYEMAQQELAFKREQFAADQAQKLREFGISEAAITGVYQGNPTMAARELEQKFGLQQGELTGYYNGQATLGREQQEWSQGFQQRQQALDEAERQRRYGLDVAQFGAQLASTPDQYFQAQRFFATDAPNLLGGGQGRTPTTFTGTPTPGIARMGSYLATGTPYGAPSGGEYGTEPWQMAEQRVAMAPRTGGEYSTTGTPYGGAGVNPAAAGSTWANLTPEAQAALTAQNGGQVPAWAATEGDWTMAAQGGPIPGYAGQTTGTAPYMPTGDAGPYGTPKAAYQPSGMPTNGDPRAKQIAAISRAVPPSPYDGLSEQDSAALKLMESVYKAGGQALDAGTYGRLKASGQTGFMESAGRLLGYDPKQLDAQFQAYRPAQQSGRLA